MTKKTYEKPAATKREKLSDIAAKPGPGPGPGPIPGTLVKVA